MRRDEDGTFKESVNVGHSLSADKRHNARHVAKPGGDGPLRISQAITVPTLVTQGDDDQIVLYKDAAELQAKLLKNSSLKIYNGFPHGVLTTHADVINPDLLAFVKA